MTHEELQVIEGRVAERERDATCCGFADEQALVAEVRRLHEVERRHDALYAHFADVHAALGTWDDKTLTAAGSVRRLVGDVDRLRTALVVAHKYAGCGDEPGSAPDCCGICAALCG